MADDEREARASDAPLDSPEMQVKLGAPLVDTVYKTLPELLATYRDHAYNKGYGVVLNARNKNKESQRIVYMCDKGGKVQDQKNPNLYHTKKRKSGSRKTDCPFRIIAQEQEDETWRG